MTLRLNTWAPQCEARQVERQPIVRYTCKLCTAFFDIFTNTFMLWQARRGCGKGTSAPVTVLEQQYRACPQDGRTGSRTIKKADYYRLSHVDMGTRFNDQTMFVNGIADS
jgi:hypothetical protein